MRWSHAGLDLGTPGSNRIQLCVRQYRQFKRHVIRTHLAELCSFMFRPHNQSISNHMIFALQMKLKSTTMTLLWMATMCFVMLLVGHVETAPAVESSKTMTVSSGWGEPSPPFFIVQPKYVQMSRPTVVKQHQPHSSKKTRKQKSESTFPTFFTSYGWGNGR